MAIQSRFVKPAFHVGQLFWKRAMAALLMDLALMGLRSPAFLPEKPVNYNLDMFIITPLPC